MDGSRPSMHQRQGSDHFHTVKIWHLNKNHKHSHLDQVQKEQAEYAGLQRLRAGTSKAPAGSEKQSLLIIQCMCY